MNEPHEKTATDKDAEKGEQLRAPSPQRRTSHLEPFSRFRKPSRGKSLTGISAHGGSSQALGSSSSFQIPSSPDKSPDQTTSETIDSLKQNMLIRKMSLSDPADANSPASIQSKLKRKTSVTLNQDSLQKVSLEYDMHEHSIEEEDDESIHRGGLSNSKAMDTSVRHPSITDEILELLKKSPGARTDDDLMALNQAFRSIKAIERYPDFVRQEVLRSVIYRRLHKNQILFRQGDPSENFYIIIEGSLGMVRPRNNNSQSHLMHLPNAAAIESRIGKTSRASISQAPASEIAAISKTKESSLGEIQTVFETGECFGEVGIVRNIARSATVVSLEPTDLLIIEKSDYEIIMKLIQEREVDERVAFLHSLPVFQSWPRSSLNALNNSLVYQTVLPTRVVIRQGDEPEGMFFILSGECTVVREVSFATSTSKLSSPSLEVRPESRQRSGSPSESRKGEDKKLLHSRFFIHKDAQSHFSHQNTHI
eukprot:TRINITY_DN5795_c0_g1_i13.p1 TRINITY_DN5795_c0_g1~~TRINITY_DN5795_c0_g1_i13.p1  ORF type:complete len:480 (-),score=69.03 TRINITY_DN5795_c0_g1_i13:534-1973(-)